MMRVMAVIVACWMAMARGAMAQSARPLIAPPAFIVDHWTTVNGLPQNSVNAIVETPDSYIWVGTFGGLARFDGLHFVLMERSDSAGRHVDRVLSLAVAPDSALWVGTENGLLRYARGKFTRYSSVDGLPGREVHAMHFDKHGQLWAGTERGAARLSGGRFVYVPAPDSAPAAVVSFGEERDGTLWVNVHGHVMKYEPGRSTLTRMPELARNGLLAMVLGDREGGRWFVKTNGVVREFKGHFEEFKVGFGPELMTQQGVTGRYWWATPEDGVREFWSDSGGRTYGYALPGGSMKYGAREILADRDGNLWVGTVRDGLLRLKRNLFTTFGTAHGLTNDIMAAVMETRDGSVWAGLNCGGVNVIDAARRTVHRYAIGPAGELGSGGCVFALTQDSSGAVWAGTWGSGLTRITNGRVEHLGNLGAIPDSVILALFTDSRGTVWVGTNTSGLAEVRDGRVQRRYTVADGLGNNSVKVICEAADGAIWIGTLEGLSRLNRDGKLITYTPRNGLSSEHVRSIYQDADGTMWIGTYGGGLNRLRDGKFASITRSDGLADNVVSSILEDDGGNLWMSGNRGIFRVSKKQLHDFADGRIRRVHSMLYGVADGLRNAETNGGFEPAAWKDHTGRLWFPTIQGLAVVDPRQAGETPRPPPVAVEEVVVDGEPQPPEEPLRLGPTPPNLEFRYTGVSLSSPEDVTFRYKLEPLDQDWVEPGTRRIAYYSRVPAGTYHFVVTAANRDGTWNRSESETSITVLAPLYERGWFVAAALMLVALILWSAHRAVLATRTTAIHEERSRLAREIHDSLLQGFVGISLQLGAASKNLSLPSAQQAQIDRVLTMVDRTLIQARHAVWDLRPSTETSQELAIECQFAAERILAGSATACRVVTRGRKRTLGLITQTESLRIVEEALTNVRKHAEARHVVVLLHYRWYRLQVTIRDDGKGFDPETDGKRPGHWGWLGMRERAARIGSRLMLESRAGSGTKISLDVAYRSIGSAWRT